MKELKTEYKRGLLYFGILMLCILLLFTTPDGKSIYYGLLGLLGINPGIPIGSGTILYIYGIIPLAAIIVCIRKVFIYWRGYGSMSNISLHIWSGDRLCNNVLLK